MKRFKREEETREDSSISSDDENVKKKKRKDKKSHSSSKYNEKKSKSNRGSEDNVFSEEEKDTEVKYKSHHHRHHYKYNLKDTKKSNYSEDIERKRINDPTHGEFKHHSKKSKYSGENEKRTKSNCFLDDEKNDHASSENEQHRHKSNYERKKNSEDKVGVKIRAKHSENNDTHRHRLSQEKPSHSRSNVDRPYFKTEPDEDRRQSRPVDSRCFNNRPQMCRPSNRNKKHTFGSGGDDESEKYEWGKKDDQDNDQKINDQQPKQKPDFGLSGKLTEDANMFNGVVIKYSEPPDARNPKRRWRLYQFKDDKNNLPVLHIHRQSAFLLGRDRKVCDIPIDHPSCSKQHAALQYRLTDYTRDNGSTGKKIRLYVIDLESANGTFVNNKRIEPKRYVELLEKDVIKFGFSTREYVLLHEHSQDSDHDDDVEE